MRIVLCSLFMISLLVFNADASDNAIRTKKLGNGWVGLAKQIDPFDKSKIEIIQISKGSFTFLCDDLNMEVSSYGFESLSFGAVLKYRIDGQDPVEKQGRYSTYLGGSDMLDKSRYFSFVMSNEDVAIIKSGATLKVAGKYSTMGWETKEVSLKGFSSAYNQMCK